jgi:hypothetical protein
MVTPTLRDSSVTASVYRRTPLYIYKFWCGGSESRMNEDFSMSSSELRDEVAFTAFRTLRFVSPSRFLVSR